MNICLTYEQNNKIKNLFVIQKPNHEPFINKQKMNKNISEATAQNKASNAFDIILAIDI